MRHREGVDVVQGDGGMALPPPDVVVARPPDGLPGDPALVQQGPVGLEPLQVPATSFSV